MKRISRSIPKICMLAIFGLVAAERLEHLSSFSLKAPYLEDTLHNIWWDYGESTVVDVQNFIRLTPELPSRSGWLWTLAGQHSGSWVVEFEFKVSYTGTLSGDGFAFWYTTRPYEKGPVFGSVDNFDGLGIMFDTYPNGNSRLQYPYIMAMIGDGKTSYSHDRDGRDQEVGGCQLDFRNAKNPTRAKVTYKRFIGLKLELDLHGKGYHTCFDINRNITLPEYGHYGFSAATGGVSAKHDIISVDTWSIEDLPPPVQSEQPFKSSNSNNQNSRQSPIPPGTGLGPLFWICMVFLLVIIGYIAWNVYAQSQHQRYKRF